MENNYENQTTHIFISTNQKKCVYNTCTIRVIKVTVNQLETADRLDLLQ